jgi:hypothetical protein
VKVTILSDQIRQYVREEIIEPARRQEQGVIQVRAGNIHATVELKDRMLAVYSALDADKFLEYAHVQLI